MLRLDKVIKPWKESAALNAHINLYGFWNDTAFLTKSGDVGTVLRVTGVDYESLDRSEQEYAVKRLEAALKGFGPGFHVYQYLFKSNRPDIPFATYDDPVVQAAVDQRRKFFEAKRDQLYQIEIFYCVVLEGQRSKTGIGAALARMFHDPAGGIGELKAQFTNDSTKTLLRSQIERSVRQLGQQVEAFCRQLADLMEVAVLNQEGQFTFFRRLLNYDAWRIAGRPQSTQFLDYQVVNSDIEAERDHLCVGDHIVRVLTMKEAITETRPLVLDALLKIPGNFQVITEWTPIPADKARKEVNKRRRHFNVSKTGFVSQMGNDVTTTNPRDVLVDESKQADIENLGDCLRCLGDGQSLGDYSLTIVLYGSSHADLEQLVGEFTGVFTNADGNLFAETYNQLNAYFAIVPGNYALNLRKLYLLNTNYADLSFLFTILPGEKTNAFLGTECLAVVETDNSTPYFLNLHTRDVAHTLILGMTGSGKTTTLAVIREAAETDGYRVEGFAPTSRAAQKLGEAAIETSTLQRHLTRGQQPDKGEKRLYVLDESSLASTRQLHEFIERLHPNDRVLLVGDRRQHEAVEAGRPFAQLQDAGMKTVKLEEILRQKDPELKQVVEQLAQGNVQEAIKNLDHQGRIHEVPVHDERISAIAKEYARSPENTLVVSPDNRSRTEINERIHAQLQGKGRVSGEEHPIRTLVPRQELTGADRTWAAKYEVGDILRYSRASKETGIGKGHYAQVQIIDAASNRLTVSLQTGAERTYDPRRQRGVSVFREELRRFSVGDRIQFTAPANDLNIANRELGLIREIKATGRLSLTMDSGRSLDIDPHKHPHLDYGYAMTSHSSQGQTVSRVLIHMDTELVAKDLLNNRMAYVSVSRGAHDAQIFTNDREKLPTALGHDVSKQTAQAPQIGADQTITPQQEISKAPQQEHGMGLGIGL